MPTDHEKFMEIALEEARKGEAKGNGPVGSVIVKDGVVIAKGFNQAISNLDVTSHAETDAMRNAGPALGHTDLTGCTLYTTFEPCMMCAGAIVFAGIDTLVLGGNYNNNYGSLRGLQRGEGLRDGRAGEYQCHPRGAGGRMRGHRLESPRPHEARGKGLALP